MRIEDRRRVERDVPARIVRRHRGAGADEARRVLLDTLYNERLRLDPRLVPWIWEC